MGISFKQQFYKPILSLLARKGGQLVLMAWKNNWSHPCLRDSCTLTITAKAQKECKWIHWNKTKFSFISAKSSNFSHILQFLPIWCYHHVNTNFSDIIVMFTHKAYSTVHRSSTSVLFLWYHVGLFREYSNFKKKKRNQTFSLNQVNTFQVHINGQVDSI